MQFALYISDFHLYFQFLNYSFVIVYSKHLEEVLLDTDPAMVKLQYTQTKLQTRLRESVL